MLAISAAVGLLSFFFYKTRKSTGSPEFELEVDAGDQTTKEQMLKKDDSSGNGAGKITYLNVFFNYWVSLCVGVTKPLPLAQVLISHTHSRRPHS